MHFKSYGTCSKRKGSKSHAEQVQTKLGKEFFPPVGNTIRVSPNDNLTLQLDFDKIESQDRDGEYYYSSFKQFIQVEGFNSNKL